MAKIKQDPETCCNKLSRNLVRIKKFPKTTSNDQDQDQDIYIKMDGMFVFQTMRLFVRMIEDLLSVLSDVNGSEKK